MNSTTAVFFPSACCKAPFKEPHLEEFHLFSSPRKGKRKGGRELQRDGAYYSF